MQYKKTAVHVWHLEMTTRPPAAPGTDLYELRKAEAPLPEFSRFLYATVGGPWQWHQRLKWRWQEWFDYLNRPGIETWVATRGATPVGYFELDRQAGGEAEIVSFGLLPEFTGMGMGKRLLTDAIDRAWRLAENRIWLHTCSLDHPHALPNYLRRGFRIFREEDFEDMIPAEPLEPWPGAGKPAPPDAPA